MRTIVFTLLMLFGIVFIFPLSCMAEEQTVSNTSVSELLQKVKASSGDARRKAMNALKLKLRTVNAATRAKTMQTLRQAFGGVPIQQGQQTISHTIHTSQQQMQHRYNVSPSQQVKSLPHTPKHPTLKRHP